MAANVDAYYHWLISTLSTTRRVILLMGLTNRRDCTEEALSLIRVLCVCDQRHLQTQVAGRITGSCSEVKIGNAMCQPTITLQ